MLEAQNLKSPIVSFPEWKLGLLLKPCIDLIQKRKTNNNMQLPYAQFKSRCPHSTANKIKMFSNHCMERLYDKSNKPSITMLATARRRNILCINADSVK